MPKTRPYLFYDVAISICSTCYRKVEAKTIFQDDNVYLLKRRVPISRVLCEKWGFCQRLTTNDERRSSSPATPSNCSRSPNLTFRLLCDFIKPYSRIFLRLGGIQWACLLTWLYYSSDDIRWVRPKHRPQEEVVR
jgi:hypothetical protein